MTRIFIINAGQDFQHSGGNYNKAVTAATEAFFSASTDFEVRTTHIDKGYVPEEEVTHYVWADVIIYHTPIWWFQLPHGFKKYIDEVFSAGYKKGIYLSDGRKADNPGINYGTGGQMHGKHYMLTTSWNAPATAFTLPGEFFDEKTVDEGPLFGFHRMNAFTGMSPLPSFHFHDVEKNADLERDLGLYREHLEMLFPGQATRYAVDDKAGCQA